MKTNDPEWYEAVIGAGLLAASVYAGMHIVHHPEHEHLYAWGFVAGIALVGLWLIAPVKARALWHELRNSTPFLNDVTPEEE